MDSIENTLKKIQREEAIRCTGWGSLDSGRRLVRLVFSYYKLESLFDCMHNFNFRVCQRHRTINGNTSHSIEIQQMRLNWQTPYSLRDAILIAEVPGNLVDFSFVLTLDQVKFLWESNCKGPYIKLVAEKVGKKVIIYCMKNGKSNSEEKKQRRFQRPNYNNHLSIQRTFYRHLD